MPPFSPPLLRALALAAPPLVLLGCAGAERTSDGTEAAATPGPGTTTGAAAAVAPVAAPAVDPWAVPAPPPKSVYDGPLFAMSHAYPNPPAPPPADPPWRAAIGNGRITTANAGAYTQALKDSIAADMQVLLFDYPSWDAGKAGWYNVPWLTDVREPIHGTYTGSTFPPGMFPASKLTQTMTTHVLVYYDEVAAGALQDIWGATGMTPVPGIQGGGAQYAESSIIVKPAFTTASGAVWPPIEGATAWPIYAAPEGGGQPVLSDVYLFQFDIIVKDSASSPETQWVFTTLVYDKDAPGATMWEKMVPLGAMWGEDPTVISPQGCETTKEGCPTLSETWINPAAPAYAKETLGWGGRLSGPNDAAVDITAAIQGADGTITPYEGRYAMSSCMSCHNSAEYELGSFLIPSPSTCADDGCIPVTATCKDGTCTADPDGERTVYYASGSADFARWFVNRPGNVPMDAGTIALDYGMNNAFKALPTWYADTQGKEMKLGRALEAHRAAQRERAK